MPFKSEAQRRFLWANRPDIAERWSKEKGAKTKGLPYYKEGSAQADGIYFTELKKLGALCLKLATEKT